MKIEGLDNLNKTLDNSSKNFKKEGQKTINKLGNKLLSKTIKRTPVDTGVLRRNWLGKSGDLEFTVSNNTKYAIFQEYGFRVVGGRGGLKGKRRKGNKKNLKPRKTSGKGFVEGVYMLTKSVKEIEQEMEKEFSIMIDNLWK